MRRFLASVGVVALVTLTLVTLVGSSADAVVPGPNGQIAFNREIPILEDFASFRIDPDGSDQARLLSGASFAPRWSPDGSEIAVGACANPPDCTTASVIVDPDTGQIVRWFPFPDPDLESPCSVWSPDGSHLACAGFGITDPDLNGVYSIDASDGTDLTRITSNPSGYDDPGDYSPDGTRIVFLRFDADRRMGRRRALFIAQVDGSSAPQRVTPWGLSEETGSWSPDGTTILFAGGGVLYTVPAEGGDVARVRLPRRGGAFDPAWSPNGEKIAFGFFARHTFQSDIWIASVTGGGMHPLTQTRRSEHFPNWGTHPAT